MVQYRLRDIFEKMRLDKESWTDNPCTNDDTSTSDNEDNSNYYEESSVSTMQPGLKVETLTTKA